MLCWKKEPDWRGWINSEINTLDTMNNRPPGADGSIKCTVAGVTVDMIIDSGSAFNTISEATWKSTHEAFLAGDLEFIPFTKAGTIKAFAYAQASPLTIIAHFLASVTTALISRPTVTAEFIVVKGANRSLLSRDTAITLNVLRMGGDIMALSFSAHSTLKKFPAAPYPEVDLDIDESISPSRQYYYRIPEAFEKRVSDKLDEMLATDIIEEVKDEEPRWLSGLSIVIKDSEKFRLVLNMRRVNQAIRRPYVIIPTIEDIRNSVRGSKYFSKFDLTSAFFHLVLNERSRNMTCFMTRRGTFRYKRLAFGLVSAPEIFQRFMNKVLEGIKGATAYLDDILIHAPTLEELDLITSMVRERMIAYKLSINEEKSEQSKTELTFLGHRLNKDGINIDEMKLESINSFRAPSNKQELRSFLGLAGFIAQYIVGYSALTEPLWKVLRGPNQFRWEEEQENAFNALKAKIASCTLTLGAFNPQAPVILYTDASPCALSAVLTQPRHNGAPVIISCASRTLTATERKYDQTNKEALAIVWASEHFQFYVLGRNFTLKTDSAGAIASLKKEDQSTNKCIMRRINGYKNRMEMFKVVFDQISSKDNIADAPSRLSTLPPSEEDNPRAGFEIATLDNAPGVPLLPEILTEGEVRDASSLDPMSQAVAAALSSDDDWPEAIMAYRRHKEELAYGDGILSRAGRIVVPQSLRRKAIALAHEGHPGMNGTKRLLRASLWWPGMDMEVESYVRACKICFHIIKACNMVPMRRSRMPSEPWELLAMDHFGPIWELNGAHVLVLIDYHSRYMFAAEVKSTNFHLTKLFMDRIFAERGYPKRIRADNGAAYRKRFDDYCIQHGIVPEHSVPYSAFQNGLAESAMKIVGKALMVAKAQRDTFGKMLSKAILAHNSTPHSTSGLIPAEAHFGSRVRYSLPKLRELPKPRSVESAQQKDWASKLKDKARRDKVMRAKDSDISAGDKVVIINRSKTKADSTYEMEQHKVISIKHGDLTLIAPDGTQRSLHVKDVKKVPAELLEQAEADEAPEETDAGPAQPIATDMDVDEEPGVLPGISNQSEQPAQEEEPLRRSERLRRGTRRDSFVYMLAKCLMQEHEEVLDLLVEAEPTEEI